MNIWKLFLKSARANPPFKISVYGPVAVFHQSCQKESSSSWRMALKIHFQQTSAEVWPRSKQLPVLSSALCWSRSSWGLSLSQSLLSVPTAAVALQSRHLSMGDQSDRVVPYELSTQKNVKTLRIGTHVHSTHVLMVTGCASRSFQKVKMRGRILTSPFTFTWWRWAWRHLEMAIQGWHHHPSSQPPGRWVSPWSDHTIQWKNTWSVLWKVANDCVCN